MSDGYLLVEAPPPPHLPVPLDMMAHWEDDETKCVVFVRFRIVSESFRIHLCPEQYQYYCSTTVQKSARNVRLLRQATASQLIHLMG